MNVQQAVEPIAVVAKWGVTATQRSYRPSGCHFLETK